MYLTSIFLFLIITFGLFPIYLSRRFNFRMFLAFIISAVFVALIYNFDFFNNICNMIGNSFYNINQNIFMERFSSLEEIMRWFKINIAIFVYLLFFILSFVLLSIFIRNKSNFRMSDNPVVKQFIKVILAFFNIVFFSIIALIMLVNLNEYLILNEGFLTRLFYIVKRIIARL